MGATGAEVGPAAGRGGGGLDRWKLCTVIKSRHLKDTRVYGRLRHAMRYLLALLCVWLIPVTAWAQTATPTDRLGFDQAAATLAVAQGFTVSLELDGVVLPTTQALTCTGAASPFACSTAIPAVTPGTHAVRLRVNETTNGATLSSAWSSALSFTMRAVPATPGNVRLVSVP